MHSKRNKKEIKMLYEKMCNTKKGSDVENEKQKSGRTSISVITLSVSGLDTPFKRQRLAKWIF